MPDVEPPRAEELPNLPSIDSRRRFAHYDSGRLKNRRVDPHLRYLSALG